MSILFWGFAAAMLIVAIGFIAVPLKSGRSLFATPIAMVVAFVPILAVGLYALLGSPDKITASPASSTRVPAAAADRPLGTVASMVHGLAKRLENEPDDADGWILLARSYQHLGRSTEALDAYRHAEALGKIDANLESEIIGKGLTEHVAPVVSGPSLRGRVSLTLDAAAQVKPGDTVFIFAKESREHRMPVVALRKNATELPLDFVLTDKEVMVPGSKLSDYQQLIVTAKISRTGSASDNTLGLEAWSDTVSPTDDVRVELLIGDAND